MQAVVGALSGGLGNQMFQYAAARALSLRLGAPLALDVSWFAGRSNRTFDLPHLNIDANGIKAQRVQRTPWLPSRLRALQSGVERRLSKRRFGVPVFREKHYHYDAAFAGLTVPVYLDGYWQSARYFAGQEKAISADFQLAEPLSSSRQPPADAIGQVLSVSVHVRRGDYVSNPKANAYHGTCSPLWYASALGKMADMLDQPHYFVFSDDPQWAQDNLPQVGPTVFVEPKADGRDFEDMALMAMCRHHIIANSSFSWWGAWLNPCDEKLVIAPENWFAGGGHMTKDLLAASWIKL